MYTAFDGQRCTTEHHPSLRRRRRGLVVGALDLQSGGPGVVFLSGFLDLFHGSSATLVNSQLVSLPPAGVLKMFMPSICNVTVQPRFNEVPRDWGNWFVISRFFSIYYTITELIKYRSLNREQRYIEVR